MEILSINYARGLISYLDGVLELMVTEERHKNINRTIEGLIISYFDHKEIGYIPVGSATYKAKKEKKGKEADSAYKFREEREFPDFAVEVNFTSGGIESLEIYKTLKTQEVWMWNSTNELSFYYLQNSEYIKIKSSYFLEKVTPEIIKKYISLIEENRLKITFYKRKFIEELFPDIS